MLITYVAGCPECWSIFLFLFLELCDNKTTYIGCIFISLYADLGVLLAVGNYREGPSTSLLILVDTDHMDIGLLSYKFTKTQVLLHTWLPKKPQILSLVGTHQYAMKLSDQAEPMQHGCSQQYPDFVTCTLSLD